MSEQYFAGIMIVIWLAAMLPLYVYFTVLALLGKNRPNWQTPSLVAWSIGFFPGIAIAEQGVVWAVLWTAFYAVAGTFAVIMWVRRKGVEG